MFHVTSYRNTCTCTFGRMRNVVGTIAVGTAFVLLTEQVDKGY